VTIPIDYSKQGGQETLPDPVADTNRLSTQKEDRKRYRQRDYAIEYRRPIEKRNHVEGKERVSLTVKGRRRSYAGLSRKEGGTRLKTL